MFANISLATLLGYARRANALTALALALFFLVGPGLICVKFLRDPRLAEGRPPEAAYALNTRLAPTYAAWARERVESGRAGALGTHDLTGTEWPMFGSVFYLWGVQALQQDWEKNGTRGGQAPRKVARDAIEACGALIADPNHAEWVRKHWGADYLTRENAFYRMMLIGGLSTYQQLSGNAQYEPIIRSQVDSLTAELDARPSGLLDDYPGECYPGDVMAAVYAIQQADALLHTDHSAFIARMRRAFVGERETQLGVPPFWADAGSGTPIEPTRGSSNSYICLTAPYLWPEDARRWYGVHARHFWQESSLFAGFREFAANDERLDTHIADMDSGPILLGYGFAATAFGVGAAITNGDLDRGGKLLAEALPSAWPLPNGALLLPRVLSDTIDAPYLGEACLLYALTRTPAPGVVITPPATRWPGLVYGLLAGYLVPGVLGSAFALRMLLAPVPHARVYRRPRLQLAVWIVLLFGAGLASVFSIKLALALLLCTQFFPRLRKVNEPVQEQYSDELAAAIA